MRLEHHLVGGYVRYISPHIIILLLQVFKKIGSFDNISFSLRYKCKKTADS